jgi:hypothetical protein
MVTLRMEKVDQKTAVWLYVLDRQTVQLRLLPHG